MLDMSPLKSTLRSFVEKRAQDISEHDAITRI